MNFNNKEWFQRSVCWLQFGNSTFKWGKGCSVLIINILIILNAKAIIHCTGVLYLGPQNDNRDTHTYTPVFYKFANT